MMNFDWDPGAGKPVGDSTGTKLMAWGSSYGWLGASAFDNFDYSGPANGTGDRTYATFIVLGPKVRFAEGQWAGDGDVEITIKAVDAVCSATISGMGPGSLVTSVRKGPGATQMKNISNGYNDTYAAYHLRSSGNHVAFTFSPAAGKPVRNPIFVVQDYTGTEIPAIKIDGNDVTVNVDGDSGAFASINMASQELWVTVNANIAAPVTVEI